MSVGVLVITALSLIPAPARAGNLDSFFLGNEAALTGGAVVALTRDAGSVWYNPAGLGGLSRSSIDLSASAYVLRIQRLPGALETKLTSGSHEEDLGSTEMLSVPSAVVATRRLSDDLTFALGIFSPVQDLFTTSTMLRTEDSVAGEGGSLDFDYSQRIQLSAQAARYCVGPAVGWQVSPRLRLGLSVFAVYDTTEVSTSFWVDLDVPQTEPPSRAVVLFFDELSTVAVGMQAVLGLQWNVTGPWHGGVTLRSPILRLYSDADFAATEVEAGTAPDTDPVVRLDFVDRLPDTEPIRQVAPPRLHVGVGRVTGGSAIAVEGDLRPAFEDSSLGIDHRPVWNVRVGGRFRTGEKLWLGGGLFTDRSPEREPTDFGDLQVDHYGATLGAELRSHFSLARGQPSGSILLTTTVAFRYSLGVGTAGGLRFAPFGEEQRVTEVDVFFHEMSLHLGSGMYF